MHATIRQSGTFEICNLFLGLFDGVLSSLLSYRIIMNHEFKGVQKKAILF
jgi:hypothetical protein